MKGLKSGGEKAQHNGDFPGLSFPIMYPRDATEGAIKPEIPVREEQESLPSKVLSL